MTTNLVSYLPGEFYGYDPLMSYGAASNIDPLLQSLPPSPPTWGPVSQYLRDPQRTAIFNAPANAQAAPPNNYHTQAAVAIRPAPAQHQVRFASPISSNELSSATALSPPGETEASYFDFDFPATPPDTTAPPAHYNRPNHCDPWGAHAHDLQFNNMGPLPYVNPAEVNHSQQPDAYEPEADSFVLDRTPSRTPSWENYHPVAPPPAAVPSHQARAATAMQPRTKQETASSYPELPYSGTSDGYSESDDEPVVLAKTKRKTEDDDSDWPPPKKLKPPTPIRSTTGRKAKTGPSTTTARRGGRKTTTSAPSPLAQPACRVPQQGQFPCPEAGCSPKQIYTDQASLDAHIKKKHTRPFKCVFHFAGCRSQFAAKNEWKRHVATQHLLLHYWICQEAECTRLPNGPSPMATNSMSSRAAGSGRSAQHRSSGAAKEKNLPNGNIFNRKDLYTQHLRRMHMPQRYKKDANKKDAGSHEWDARLRALQEGAVRTRCALPEAMKCPAAACEEEFRGPEAWDQRMEHVARHMDAAARGMGPAVEFGGERDKCLVEWAGRGDVRIIEPAQGGEGWVLSVGCGGAVAGEAPRKRGDKGEGRRAKGRAVRDVIVVGVEEDEDEDAEGDDDF